MIYIVCFFSFGQSFCRWKCPSKVKMIYAISLTLLTKPLVARSVMTVNQMSIENYFKAFVYPQLASLAFLITKWDLWSSTTQLLCRGRKCLADTEISEAQKCLLVVTAKAKSADLVLVLWKALKASNPYRNI